NYRETYYHYDAEGNIDWAFIEVSVYPAEQQFCSTVFCGKFIENDMNCLVFIFGIVVYDVKADEFRGVSHPDNLELDGFEEYVWENIGEFMGDADADGELTVLDATFIQQALAGIHEFSLGDNKPYYETPFYLSDYDQDGQRTVMDATAIQMKLAGIEA
ncbi:MAG: dockerin type I repeat-containing protein, partial [Ruminococcus sp.]|nr:dockerin type I repeat-containing protein [Ruminococcus sp.]